MNRMYSITCLRSVRVQIGLSRWRSSKLRCSSSASRVNCSRKEAGSPKTCGSMTLASP